MKKISVLILFMGSVLFGQSDEKILITKALDDWHSAAGSADFDAYFGLMTEDAVFIGTDATENWQRDEFINYAKPHFDKGRAWNFTAFERNIYLNSEMNFAWFDELLDTQMKICRGSGVLKKVSGEWKIAHYVLSIAVPNENVDALVKIKSEKDSLLMQQIRNK
tara:strand:- start:35792 stop:36283 length:492 start_codon:yes stop_codon:yes gene_type:complete